jgi:outer membrane protein assembly factor BamB
MAGKQFAWSLVAALAAAALTPAAAGEGRGGAWPQFGGAGLDSVSAETGLLKQWPEGGPKLLWKFAECGRGYAGVSVVDGRLFTSGDFGGKEFVLALDLDGKLLWRTPNGPSWRGPTPGSRVTPTCADGLLYHLNPTGRLAALEAATGKERWAVDLATTFAARHGTWALAENLVVEGRMLLCTPGGEKGRVVALDKATGKTIWANTKIPDRASYSSPIVVTHNGVRQFIALMERSVVGVDVRTGKLLWSHRHPSRYDQNSTRPLYHEGRVLVTGGHRGGARMLAIHPKSDGVKEAWFNETFDNCHGGILLRGGRLYGSACRIHKKGLLCVDLRTGKTVYSEKSIGKVSIAYADGLLYGLDQKGRMMLVDVGPKSARIVSAFRIPWEHRDQSLAHPVVCGGRLYLRHGQNLFAYDIRAASAAR